MAEKNNNPNKKNPLTLTVQKEFEVWKSLLHLKTTLEIHHIRWQNAAYLLGSAYLHAYEQQKAVLEQRAEDAQMRKEFLFAAITTVATGLLGGIGECASSAILNTIWANAEDAVQAAVGEGLDLATVQAIKPAGEKLNVHPHMYQNDLMRNLNNQWLTVLEHISEVEAALLSVAPSNRQKLQSFQELCDIMKSYWEEPPKGGQEKFKLTIPENATFEQLSVSIEKQMWRSWWNNVLRANWQTVNTCVRTDRRFIELGIAAETKARVPGCSMIINESEKTIESNRNSANHDFASYFDHYLTETYEI